MGVPMPTEMAGAGLLLPQETSWTHADGIPCAPRLGGTHALHTNPIQLPSKWSGQPGPC